MLSTRYLNENDIPAARKLVATESNMYCIDFEIEDIDDSGFFIGLFKDGELIGICTIGSADCETEDIHNDEDCILSNVYIKENERNQKYGQYMIENALKLANEQYGDVKCHISLLESSLSVWYGEIGFYQTVTDDFGICAMAYDLRKGD